MRLRQGNRHNRDSSIQGPVRQTGKKYCIPKYPFLGQYHASLFGPQTEVAPLLFVNLLDFFFPSLSSRSSSFEVFFFFHPT